jgi:hypothetical protein
LDTGGDSELIQRAGKVRCRDSIAEPDMEDLLDEMRRCKSVQACIDLALTDAYGPDEQAVAWLTCIEVMFSRFKHVKVMGTDVQLVGFDLSNEKLVAVCRQDKRKARVSLESVEFPELTPIEARWLRAWKRFSVLHS